MEWSSSERLMQCVRTSFDAGDTLLSHFGGFDDGFPILCERGDSNSDTHSVMLYTYAFRPTLDE